MSDDEQDSPEGRAYNAWFYGVREPKTNMPYATIMLYRVAEDDGPRFLAGEEIMRAAFMAGRASAKEELK